MKKWRGWCLLALFIIIVVVAMPVLQTSSASEGFTPRIRETYRPLLRSVRMSVEGFYTRWSKYIGAKMGRYT